MIPVLSTDRLILRGPRMDDYPDFEAFYASPRAEGTGGVLTPQLAFQRFAGIAGHWVLMGFGWWMVEYQGRAVGYVGVHNPPYKADIELGWAVYKNVEGKSIAYEATMAARAWAIETLSLTRLVSYIDRTNERSNRLAKRLGAAPEAAPAPHNPCARTWVHPLEALR